MWQWRLVTVHWMWKQWLRTHHTSTIKGHVTEKGKTRRELEISLYVTLGSFSSPYWHCPITYCNMHNLRNSTLNHYSVNFFPKKWPCWNYTLFFPFCLSRISSILSACRRKRGWALCEARGSPAGSLDGRHDLDVLESAVRRVVVRVAAGDASAVAHGDRYGGQFCQALVLPVHRQLINVEVSDFKALLLG